MKTLQQDYAKLKLEELKKGLLREIETNREITVAEIEKYNSMCFEYEAAKQKDNERIDITRGYAG